MSINTTKTAMPTAIETAKVAMLYCCDSHHHSNVDVDSHTSATRELQQHQHVCPQHTWRRVQRRWEERLRQ